MTIFFLQGFTPLGPAAKERAMIFGAVALVVLPIIIWAWLARKRRRRQRHRHHHGHRSEHTAAPVDPPKEEFQRSRRRRRRREHRPRNPTLAETGGLPPVRPDDVPPPI